MVKYPVPVIFKTPVAAAPAGPVIVRLDGETDRGPFADGGVAVSVTGTVATLPADVVMVTVP
jgi:hypothetical protein